MHSYYEINELRKCGECQKALEMTNEVVAENPQCPWVYNLQANCVADLMSGCATIARSKEFFAYLQQFADLVKEHNIESFTTNRSIWPVRAFVVDSISAGNIYDEILNRLFAIIQQINFDPKDKNYAILLGAFLKAKNKTRQWSGMKAFIEWWNLENIKEKDCEPYTMDNGRKIMSTAEQAYIAYAKILLSEVAENKVNVEVVKKYIDLLGAVEEKHKDFQYPPYFRAKLLLAIGCNEEAVRVLLPFAQKKSRDFWVWQLLGEAVADPDLRFSCYCKALTCQSKDDMLCKTHLKMCDLLLTRKLYNEAKTELDAAIELYKRNQWHLSQVYQDYTQEQWYVDAQAYKNNNVLYSNYVFEAEELIFANKPMVELVVTYIDTNIHKAYFSTTDRQKGNFMTDRIPRRKRPSVGDVLKCRMECETGRWNLYTIEKVVDCSAYEDVLIKHVEGSINVNENGNGFVKNVFVPAKIMHGVVSGMSVCCTAVLSYNKMKSAWGWTAVNIETL